MVEVETLKGPIPVDELGNTLMHEHVFTLDADYVANYGDGDWWDEDAEVAKATTKLRHLNSLGIDTIVDPTVLGLGRNIPRLLRVAAEVDLQIIVATGLYTYGDLPFPYTQRGPGTMLGGDEQMITDFTRDITEGIGSTQVKAAFLKCAVEHAAMSPGVDRTLRAVAQTSVDTGAPITVHTNMREGTAPLAVDVLVAEGVDMTKVVIGHAGDSDDLDVLMALADTGAILGMDRFGLDVFGSTDERVTTIVSLVERGYGDRMVLSHDASCFIDWFGPDPTALQEVLMPNWHYEHISHDVLPALLAAGVTQAQIDQMLISTPMRYFGG